MTTIRIICKSLFMLEGRMGWQGIKAIAYRNRPDRSLNMVQ